MTATQTKPCYTLTEVARISFPACSAFDPVATRVVGGAEVKFDHPRDLFNALRLKGAQQERPLTLERITATQGDETALELYTTIGTGHLDIGNSQTDALAMMKGRLIFGAVANGGGIKTPNAEALMTQLHEEIMRLSC